jgi:hypothetical protein
VYDVNLLELKEKLDFEFKKGTVAPHVLLDRLRVIDESSRKTAAYQDPRYIPFYYHLGKFIAPKTLVEVGFGLGFYISCFLKSCKSVEKILAFESETEQFYSPRLGIANVKDTYKKELSVCVGKPLDDVFIEALGRNSWDLAFINDITSLDTHRNYLELIWEKMNLDGFVVMDYLSRHKIAFDAFTGFCKIVNRKPVFFETRYGVGIVEK